MAENPDVVRLLASVLLSGTEGSVLERLCVRARVGLGVDALAVTLLSVPDHRQVVCATDELVMVVEDQQFTSGDGPVIEAFRDDRVILVPDLRSEPLSRWPLFGEATAHGSRYTGAFAFPLVADLAGPIGVMAMYTYRARDLDAAAVAEAQLIAHALTLAVVHLSQHPPEDGGGGLGDALGGDPDGAVDGVVGASVTQWSGAEEVVYQAVGMVIAQLRTTPEEALARLRAHAFAGSSTLDQVAMAVVERRLALEA